MRLAPPLMTFLAACLRALETGDASEATARLEGARTFVRENQAVFEATSALAPMDSGGVDRVREIREDFTRVLGSLDELEQALGGGNTPYLQKGVHDLEARLGTLLEDLSALSQLESERPQQSPMPAIDQLIKLGLNVAEGHVRPEGLRARLPQLADTIRNVRADIGRFEALYAATPERVAAAREALVDLEAGGGALFEYLQSGERQPLMEGLKLLKTGSAALMEGLSALDDQARSMSRFSRLAPVEEMARALEAWNAQRIDDAPLHRVAATLHALGRLYVTQTEQISRFPLAFTVREGIEACRQAMFRLEDVARPWFARLKADPRATAADGNALQTLKEGFEGAAAALQAVQTDLEARSRSLAGAPRLEELVDFLGRIAAGAATPDEAREALDRLVTQQDELLDEIHQAGSPPSTAPMEQLLLEQRQAVLEMGLYLEDADEAHLRAGFAVLEATQPRLLALHQETREAVESQRRARERTVSCFRCGAANPVQNRYCQACNAVLPTMATQDETVYTDIVGGVETQGESAQVARLRALYELAESGGDLHAIMDELATFHGKLTSTLGDYDRVHGPRLEASQDGRVGEYARLFRRNLELLIEGVATMHVGAENANLDYMVRGLELAQAAGEEMRGAQAEIQEITGAH